MFPLNWKRKKARANREYRRKSQELLMPAKPGLAAEQIDPLAEDLTAARFEKSVSRRRLQKSGTVTVGEKVKRKLQRREEASGRNPERRQQYDRSAALAIGILASLRDDRLVDVVRRADLLCNQRNVDEFKRVLRSRDPVDCALHFLYLVASGSAFQIDALRRNQELAKRFDAWVGKANRILERGRRAEEKKLREKQMVRKKLKPSRRPGGAVISDQH